MSNETSVAFDAAALAWDELAWGKQGGLLPAIVLDAYPDGPIKPLRAIELARSILPTPPFRDT